uniref:hypothetical protein n=1 Tax=Mediterraneibacter glycyrrhizinilyticus TaxID=342942 RepID=UPI000AA32D7B
MIEELGIQTRDSNGELLGASDMQKSYKINLEACHPHREMRHCRQSLAPMQQERLL